MLCAFSIRYPSLKANTPAFQSAPNLIYSSAVDASGVAHREVETFESKMMKGNNPVVAGFAKPEEQKVTASVTNGKKLVFRKHIA